MKFKRIISSLFLFLSLTLSSCSIFGGTSEGLMIDRVESSTSANGSTLVTMYFTDSDVEPLTFEIPKGAVGETGPVGVAGLGIKDISATQSSDGLSTILTITFTSDEVPPETITVPNGVSVVESTLVVDPDTDQYQFVFTLSNGDTIRTNTFDKPKDGIGISDVQQTKLENGDIIITIFYSDPSMGKNGQTVITIPYKNGEDGRGIARIVGTQLDDLYYITIFYDDETSEPLDPIQLPTATQWLYGYGAPNSIIAAQAKLGDYYFDQENYIIYFYDGSSFVEVINLTENNQSTKQCTVTFDPNGGRFISETIGKIVVPSGSTIQLASIPLCSMEGYSFQGYYTTAEGPANPLSGKLTDLTPIYNDVTFYAYYEALSA